MWGPSESDLKFLFGVIVALCFTVGVIIGAIVMWWLA
jgi:hypothetical protein